MYECHENAEEYSHIIERIMQILPGGNEKNYRNLILTLFIPFNVI
jgi:hypothetical protein